MDIKLLIALFSMASVLLPLCLVFMQWGKLPENISSLRWLLVCNILCDLTQLVLGLGFSINNMFVGDIHLLIQFSFLLYIFRHESERKDTLKFFYTALVIMYALGLLLSRNSPMATSATNTLASLILIIVAILFFFKLLNDLKVENVHRLPILWIALATLFYYSGNLFIFLSSNYLLNKTDFFGDAWTQHNILNITKNLLFAVALWQSYRTTKLSV